MVAMLAMALLPTVSQALGHARGGSTTWTEVCTPQGMRLVALPDDAAAPGAHDTSPLQAAGHLEHCPLCTLAQDTPALPAPQAQQLPVLDASETLPRPLQHAPHTQPAWLSAQPRGPPSVS